MKQFSAYYKAEQDGDPDEAFPLPFLLHFQSIITVLAEDKAGAVERITEELNKNPSRQWYLTRWIQDGKIIRERE